MRPLKTGWNANTVKLLAIGAMTVDHIAWLLFPGYPRALLPILMHLLGRITCPIMCYFIAEGYHYTKNIGKYTRRLFLFALISHFAYVFQSEGYEGWHSFWPFSGGVLNRTSVLWALAWGLVMLRIANSGQIRREPVRVGLILLVCLVSLPSDWSCIASLCILAFGTNRGDFRTQMKWMLLYVGMYSIVYCLAIDPVYGLLQLGVVLAIPVLKRYNGQLGQDPRVNRVMKWGFYVYYPLHLTVLGLIRLATR